jgi:hypothetical protein
LATEQRNILREFREFDVDRYLCGGPASPMNDMAAGAGVFDRGAHPGGAVWFLSLDSAQVLHLARAGAVIITPFTRSSNEERRRVSEGTVRFVCDSSHAIP